MTDLLDSLAAFPNDRAGQLKMDKVFINRVEGYGHRQNDLLTTFLNKQVLHDDG